MPDAYGREHIRTITHGNGEVRELTQEWSLTGRLKTRTLVRRYKGQTETLREETFDYDTRSRLKDYRVRGGQLPMDAGGNAFVRQRFTFDALSNIRTCETTLDRAGGDSVVLATYGYAADDPCRLKSVTYNKEAQAHGYRDLNFGDADYDKAGRLLKDEAGRHLSYDAAGRLVQVKQDGQSGGRYGYDAAGRLVWQQVDRTQTLHRLYYRGSRLVNKCISPGESAVQDVKTDRLMRLTEVRQHIRENGTNDILLLGADGAGSVLTGNDTTTRDYRYSPYGYLSRAEHGSEKQTESVRGWNGERQDPVTGTTHLGNGYRAYNPALMWFHCPDSLSPFGAGGINPYAYCGGDPINHADPTGHLSWNGWLSIGLGIAGIGLAVFTLGTASALSAVMIGMAVLDVTSGALAIASGALEEKDPEMSAKLGWASLGVGGPSMVYGGVKLVQGGSLMRSGVNMYHYAATADMSSAGARVSKVADASAAVQGAKAGVTVASLAGEGAKGGYDASQVSHWDRVAIRRLEDGRLTGGANDAEAYIRVPRNFIHDVPTEKDTNGEVFIASYDLLSGIKSGGEYNNHFKNLFKEKEWCFLENYRLNQDVLYHADDVFYYQQEQAKNLLGDTMPEIIRREAVVNEETNRMTEGKTGEDLIDAFFKTPNGKSTYRIMNYYGLTACEAERIESLVGYDYRIALNPVSL